MDFAPDPTLEAWRREVRDFLAAHITVEMMRRVRDTGTVHDWGLHRALAERGWLAAAWPASQGGQGRDAREMAVLHEEIARAGAPVDGWGTSDLVARTLAVLGTEAQREAVIPRVLRGEIVICLGYSEPDSGSDVASARTRARRDGQEWVIDGQKMFTTLAHEAAFVFLLTRTNPEAAKHRGLTMFLVPLDAAGVEIHPVRTMGGERTNMTFYRSVRVGDDARVGDVDGGWEVMKVALAFEHEPTAHGEGARLLEQGRRWLGPIGDGLGRQRMARMVEDNWVGGLLAGRLRQTVAEGRLPVVEGSMAKLWSSEAYRRASSEMLDLVGPAGMLAGDGPLEGALEQAWRHAPVTTIAGGTSEIQRTIIAERGLGLPSDRG